MKQAAIDFLFTVNKKFLEIWDKTQQTVENASSELVEKLNEVSWEEDKRTTTWKNTGELGAKIKANNDESLRGDVPFKTFIGILNANEILVSPFTFWSFIFAKNGKKGESAWNNILTQLIPNKSDAKTIIDGLIAIRNPNAPNLTIEHWIQNIADLSEYAELCWKLFKDLMEINPEKGKSALESINKKIADIIKNDSNGENDSNGVGEKGIENILRFIRPDLIFRFDKGHVINIMKSSEVQMRETIELLKGSKQIILTGAPGTGKTYLATKIAEEMIKDARTDEEIAKITEEVKQTEEYKKAGTDEEKAKIAEADKEKLTEEEKKLFQKVQFHPGYDYSDFIIGLKPEVKDGQEVKGGQVTFDWKDGVFKTFAQKAYDEYKKAEEQALKAKDEKINAKPYIFIIDEINRADLSRVLGEVFSLLEEDYRYPNKEKGITLPDGKDFILPPNLYIIGTMNDIDRSVESMDFALRRRFSWKEVTAEESTHIIDAKDKEDKEKIEKPEHRAALQRAMNELNIYIGGEEEAKKKEKLKINGQDVSLNLGKEYQLGGAYFLNFAKYQKESNPFESLWNNHIAIILNEYLRGRSNRQDIVSALKEVYDNALKDNKENAKPAEDKKGTTPSSASETAPDGANQ